MTFILVLALTYYLITGPYRHKFDANALKPTPKQQMFFYGALVLLYIVKGSPVDLLTHIMLSFHMAQLAIFLLLVPIFLIKGIPAWIWSKIVRTRPIEPILRILTKPLIALLLFNGLFSFYHIPAVFNFSKSSQLAHSSFAIILFIAAFIMWWPLISPLENKKPLHPLLKLAYIAGNGVLFTPACVLIIFASHPLFDAYSQNGAWIQALALCVPGDVLNNLQFAISGPEMFSSMTTMEDQQLGGILMKTMQEAVYITLMARIFFGWFTRESLKVDPLPADLPQVGIQETN